MKQILFFCFYSLPFASGQGLILDEAAYLNTPKVADFQWDGNKSHQTHPLECSLKKYCPIPNQQGNTPSCMFQGLGYGAMTMLYAQQNHLESVQQIQPVAFSALYGYNQISYCKYMGFRDALNWLKTKGNVFLSDFEHQKRDDCYLKTTTELDKKASAFKIKDALRLTDLSESFEVKKSKIQQSIVAGKPVIVGMNLPESSKTYGGRSEYYRIRDMATFGHVMVIVGYDEYGFELLNSWGTDWGNQGFVKIQYDNFFQYVKEFYQLVFEKKMDIVRVLGTFEVRTFTQGALTPTAFQWKNRYYESVQQCFIGQKFQLVGTDLQQNNYVYVFSKDPTGKVNWHWPKRTLNELGEVQWQESPLTPYEGSAFVIPDPKRAFIKNQLGRDYLFVLYSHKELEIKDLYNRVQAFESDANTDVLQNFERHFKDICAERSEIQYDPIKPHFTAVTQKAVPLIFKIEVK
jgi:Papain family cysteine protease